MSKPHTRAIYCMRCRKTTESDHLEHIVTKNKKNAVRGKCTVCGTTTYTIVKSEK
jgi:hypothetical protein